MGETPLLRLGIALLLILAVLGIGTELLMRQLGVGGDGRPKSSQKADDTSGGRENDSATAALAAAGAGGVGRDSATAAPCSVVVSDIQLPRHLHESSGIAQSRVTPGILWSHVDSGDPIVYAIDSAGGDHGRVRLAGATNLNWEDIEVAPCASGSCMYVGDIGDNQARRPFITVYRLPEPRPDADTVPAEALSARYPDGPQDAEAMFVLPSGEIYIASKGETGPAALYRYPQPLRPGTTVTLEKVAAISAQPLKRPERLTGGSTSADGRWIALRTIDRVSFFRVDSGGVRSLANPLVMDLKPLNEKQGEGVGFGTGGTVWLTSEGGGSKRNPATLARLACTLPN